MINWNNFLPNKEEKKSGILCKNVVRCSICGSPANRLECGIFECIKNTNHIADTFTGIFTDIGYD